MDARRFDEIVRRLSAALSRRSAVGGALGTAVLAAFGLDRNDGETRRRRISNRESGEIRRQRCTRNGTVCGSAKNLASCATCCSGFNITTAGKKYKCACKPDGKNCKNNTQCCAGVCDQGVCGALS